ncbi:phosphoribosyltransferase [Mycobacterium paragordonae]|uniref:phosphoribosyltransferase n=1 Tax=Mycobacterium paragordonae TaxID=1389713 RepID=UPI00105F3962|nr:phosphoribosyltransferase [Mycobacterium paragordonae]TDK94230.1 phosphoribosyltransferase [Mycobacterium paragordonae]TDL05397.1 phosphoribosyltransferase [Mycobacterium paragordonae]
MGHLNGEAYYDPPIDHLEIDLTSLHYADVRALAKLAIVACTAVQSIDQIVVTLPRKPEAERYIRYVKFVEAIENAPNPAGKALPLDRQKTKDAGYRNVVPLTWLTTTTDLQKFLASVLSQATDNDGYHRLGTEDVHALSDVILAELVENVEVHSGTYGALVAVWTQHTAQDLDSDNYEGGERDYFKAFQGAKVSSLVLYVADRGIGVPASLGPSYPNKSEKQVMTIAFDRWSSSVDRSATRGTRGLYRIDRIAKRYRGLVTLSSGKVCAGRQYADPTSPQEFFYQHKAALPGTHLSLELPLSLYERDCLAVGRHLSLNLVHHTLRPQEPASKADLRDELIQVGGHLDSTRVIDLCDYAPSHQDCVTLLRSLAELSHPYKTVVIGLGMSDVALQDACEDVNDEIQRDLTSPGDMRASAEPILIIGSSFHKAFWVGTLPHAAENLRRVCENNIAANLSSLHGTSLGQFDETGKWSLALTPSNVWRACLDEFTAHVDAHTRRPRSGLFVTPALAVVDRWINVSRLAQASDHLSGTIVRLITSALERDHPGVIATRPSIIYESIIGEDFARMLATRLQSGHLESNYYQRVRPRDIQAGRRLSLDPARKVLILVGALSSGETARQLIALATRQGYRVLGVVTLVDMRARPSDEIALWERVFHVTPICVMASTVDQQISPQRTFLDSRGQKESAKVAASFPIGTERAVALLSNVNAIYLGHYAGAIDRHFTFYIDALAALSDSTARAELLMPMVSKVHDWLSAKRRFPILRFPQGETQGRSPANLIADVLSSALENTAIGKLDPSSRVNFPLRGRDVIHVDWGSVTGESIISTLSAYQSRQARSVLFLTLFAQLPESLEAHFLSLSAYTLQNNDMMAIEIWFGARLPVQAYPQEQCPICYQLASRGQWIEQNFVEGHTQEEERLAVRTWPPERAITSADPVALQYADGTNPQSDNASALLRRAELVQSQSSVRGAYRYRRLLENLIDVEGAFRGLITLLIFEPQWLRVPPLSQSDLRGMLGEQCMDNLRRPSLADRDMRAKCIIAYRLISKRAFAHRFSEIFHLIVGDTELESLCIYMCATVLSRAYLHLTGLPHLLSEEIVAVLDSKLALRDQTRRDLQAAYKRAVALRQQAQQERPLWEQLSLLSQTLQSDLPYHSVFQINPQIAQRSVRKAISHWRTIHRWMRREVNPYVSALSTYLLSTSYLVESPEFELIFSEASDPIEEIIAALTESLKSGANGIDDCLQSRIEEVYTHLMALVIVGDESRGLLLAAVDECRIKFSDICSRFVRACEPHSIRFSSNSSQCGDIYVLISSGYLEDVVRQIIENAVAYRTSGDVAIEVMLEMSDGQVTPGHDLVIVITTTGTKRQERDANRLGRGGLTELDLRAPTGIRVVSMEHDGDSGYKVHMYAQLGYKRIRGI